MRNKKIKNRNKKRNGFDVWLTHFQIEMNHKIIKCDTSSLYDVYYRDSNLFFKYFFSNYSNLFPQVIVF